MTASRAMSWRRLRPWYRRWLPALYAGALLVPVAGMAGNVRHQQPVA